MKTLAASVRGTESASTLDRARSLLELGFDFVTLEEPLHAAVWEELRGMLPRESVVAVRLFVPYPKSVRPGSRSGFRLGLTDAGDRGEVLKQAKETLRVADDRSIPRVLVPVASVDDEPHRRSPGYKRSQDPETAKVFDSYRSTLYELLSLADRYDVTLCLTPTPRRNEVPSLGEAEACLREFDGGPVALWLDTARLPELELPDLEAGSDEGLRSALHGISVHDVGGGVEGLTPGRGDIDWKEVEGTLTASPIWALDLRAGASLDEFTRGREFFEQLESPPQDDQALVLPPS